MSYRIGGKCLAVLAAVTVFGACSTDSLVGPNDAGLPVKSAAPASGGLQASVASTPCPPTVPSGYTLVTCFDFTTIPGVWHGFIVGSSIQPASAGEEGQLSAEYVLLSPTGLSRLAPGAIVDVNQATYTFESEFNGQVWNDVLRILTPANEPAQAVTIAVVKRPLVPIASTPCPPTVPSGYTLVTCFDFTTTPGVWHGFIVGSSIQPASAGADGQLSAEYMLLSPTGLSPLAPGAIVDVYQATYAFESEFNGVVWNDVLRILTPADRPAQAVTIAVVKRALTPALQAEDIASQVSQLQASGVLTASRAEALTRPLQNAIVSINAGRTLTAVTLLRAFELEVRALMRPRNSTLTPAQGMDLIGAAEAVIARLRE